MKKLKSTINVENGCFSNNNHDITVNMDKRLNMFFFGEYVLKTVNVFSKLKSTIQEISIQNFLCSSLV